MENNWYSEMYFDDNSYGQLSNVDVEFYDEEQNITIAQKKTFDYINNNQKKVIDALNNAIVKEYPKLMIDWYGEDEYNEDTFLKILTPQDADAQIKLCYCYLLDDELDGFAYYGFAGGCSWDEEHGFGILMYKDEIIEFGDHALAFSGSVEVYKHKNDGSYEKHLEWWRQHEEELSKRRQQQILTESRQSTKKWWQFWK